MFWNDIFWIQNLPGFQMRENLILCEILHVMKLQLDFFEKNNQQKIFVRKVIYFYGLEFNI